MNSSPFIGRPLASEQIAQAFPLLMLARVRVSAEQWWWFARAILGETAPPPVGIMTVQDSRGYIQGLFRFRASADGRGVPTLYVDDLVAFDLVGAPVADSMVDLLDSLAQRLRCAAIDIGLPLPAGTDARLQDRLFGSGYDVRCRSLVKPAAPIH